MNSIIKLLILLVILINTCLTYVSNSYAQCPPHPSGSQDSNSADNSGTSWEVEIITPFDPNEIVGPDGYDSIHWVSIKDHMGYTINYENDPTMATAPAKNVYLFYPVPSKQDMATFRLGSYGFNGDVFDVPANRSFYSTRLDLRDSLGLYVDVTAGIDVIHRRAFWIFESIDPVTGLPPEDPLVGLLPVKDSTITYLGDTLAVDGEGFVNFTIKPKTNSLTYDEVLATAKIVFDQNDTIPTNVELNTIDAFPPQSQISATPPVGNTATLYFNATDDGSGVRSYDLYVAQDSFNYITYLTNVTDSVIQFTGLTGSQYHIFSLATDNTGNREALKSAPDINLDFSSGCSTIVTSTTDSGGGSLRDAINCAVSGSIITFAPALMGQTITLSTGEIIINKNLTIAGPGVLNLTLSGDNSSRIFHLLPSDTLILKNLSLKNADSVTNGGALFVEGYLTLQNVLFENNAQNGVPKAMTILAPAVIQVSGNVEIKN